MLNRVLNRATMPDRLLDGVLDHDFWQTVAHRGIPLAYRDGIPWHTVGIPVAYRGVPWHTVTGCGIPWHTVGIPCDLYVL